MDYFQQAKKGLFRFEYLQEYKVPGEWEEFVQYQNTQKLQISPSDEEWWSFLDRLHEKGIKTQRVRLVREPKNDYTKWELLLHAQALAHGDDVRIIGGDKITPALDLLKDFWLIDSTTVLSMKYSEKGEYLGFELDDELTKYLSAKAYLLKTSTPLTPQVIAAAMA